MAVNYYNDDSYNIVVYVLGPIGLAACCSIGTMFLVKSYIEPFWFYVPLATLSIVAKQRRWW